LQKNQKKNHFDHLPWNGKPYNFFGDYLDSKYNCKVLKLPINASLGCPNRDGKISRGGCIFCSEDGSSSPTALQSGQIIDQMDFAAKSHSRTFVDVRYIAYFQAYSNTYGSIPVLKNLYDTAISYNKTIGLMIGTRPDCIDESIIQLISSYQKDEFELWIELGMQTSCNPSLEILNRGHTNEQTLAAIELCSKYNLNICLHIILGIPGESWSDMMKTAELISTLPVKGVKLHHLHVIKNTPLHERYLKDEIKLLSFHEYLDTLCDFIERLRGDILIHRIAGDKNEDHLIAPSWGMLKGSVQTGLINKFIQRGSWQGLLFKWETNYRQAHSR
jgi:radical SAM protein (TIGR01212 family)